MLVSFSQQSKTGDIKSNAETSGELWSLLYKKDFANDGLEALCSIPLGGSIRQYRMLGRLTTTAGEPFQEGDVEVGVDHNFDPVLSEDCRRIFEAVTCGDFKALSTLLTNSTTETNAVDSDGNTALHSAAISACRKGDTRDGFYHCIDLLMNCQQMKVNMPNKEGYTAVGYAVSDFNLTCVEHVLKHPSAGRLYLDYYPGVSEHTVREIIMQTYPDLEPILPAPLMERLDSPDRDIKLLAALQHNEFDIFHENFNPDVPNPSYDEPYHSSLLEISCQMKKRKEFVKLLLDSGADPNIKNRVTGMPLVHATARSGNFELLELLLKKKEIDVSVKDNEQRTILHWLAWVSERKSGDKERLENCLKLILGSDSCPYVGIDNRDIWGNTALCTAVECGLLDRVILLLSNGADIMVLKHGIPILASLSVPMLEAILDDCLESSDEPVTSKNIKLSFRYEFLNKTVPHIYKNKYHKVLLRHPVLLTFLSLKWTQIKFIFLLDLVIYGTFVLFLTAYILSSKSLHRQVTGIVVNNTTSPLNFNDSYATPGMNDVTWNNNSSLFWYPLFFFLVLISMKETFQLFVYGWTHIRSLETWLSILLIIITSISCSNLLESTEEKLHFFAVAILLGWLELLLLSGRLPLLSVQMEMLRRVSWTFLRFMAGYILLLIAFTLSFYVLFEGSMQLDGANLFSDPFLSALKTTVMFAGEFDASSLSFDALPGTSHVIFLLFVFMVAIVLLNLLIGLAVGDADLIRKEAETLSIEARVALIYKIETMLRKVSRFMTHKKVSIETFAFYPNRENSIGSSAVQSLLRIISKKRHPTKERELTECEQNWLLVREKLSVLQKRHEELEAKLNLNFDETRKVLTKILSHLDILESERTHV
jgi:ankyrin repeat protein